MTERRKLVLLTVLVLALAGMSVAQTPQALPSDPNMVYVPVAVTGAKNAYIGGLTKENFQLREDNVAQTVSYFSENQPYDIDIILAMAALQRGRPDLNSQKIREAVEAFRQTGNPGNRYAVEEMPFGSNGVFDAISRHVARLTTSTNPRKAIIVLTDGFDSAGGDPGRALQEYAKKEDVAVYIFFAPSGQGVNAPDGLAGGRGNMSDDIIDVGRGRQIFLEAGTIYEDLSKFTGGRLYQAEADTQLRANLQFLAEELKSQYVLGFKSTNDARNDKWRKLEVKITPPAGQKDLKTKVKERYFVAKVAK